MTTRTGRMIAALILLVASTNALRAQDGMIGINFMRSNGATAISPTGMAGYLPQINWNNAGTTGDPQRGGLAQIQSPSAGVIVDSTGTPIPGLNVNWASATTWSAPNSGTPDNNLMSGYIDNNSTYPTTFVRISGIPYANYAVVAYMGSDGNGRTGTVAIAGGNSVSYSTNSAPFTVYSENSNVALFEGLSGSSVMVLNHRGSNNGGLHGIQIVEVPGPPVARTPPTLAAYYSFDNAANVMQDSQGLNNGNLIGNAAQGVGRFGAGSLALDSAGDWGQVDLPTAEIKPTANLAVSVWVNRTDTAASEVVSLGDHYGLRVNADGSIHFFEDNGGGWIGMNTSAANGEVIPSDGTWHHIVAQKSTNHFEVWIDGQMARTAGAVLYETTPIDYNGLGTAFFVGKHGNGSSDLDFGGRIDELRIFNGLLNDAEIQNLYTQNAVPEPSTFVLAGMAVAFVAVRRIRRRA